jgi:hypothetical protein
MRKKHLAIPSFRGNMARALLHFSTTRQPIYQSFPYESLRAEQAFIQNSKAVASYLVCSNSSQDETGPRTTHTATSTRAAISLPV